MYIHKEVENGDQNKCLYSVFIALLTIVKRCIELFYAKHWKLVCTLQSCFHLTLDLKTDFLIYHSIPLSEAVMTSNFLNVLGNWLSSSVWKQQVEQWPLIFPLKTFFSWLSRHYRIDIFYLLSVCVFSVFFSALVNFSFLCWFLLNSLLSDWRSTPLASLGPLLFSVYTQWLSMSLHLRV